MGLLDRLGRLLRANFGSIVSQNEDPERVLEQAVQDMQANLIQLRQSVAQAIATEKRTQRQRDNAQLQAQEWYNRAQLALQKGDEATAREALVRRKTYSDAAQTMGVQIDQQEQIVAKLKQNMRTLETKLAEVKTQKDMYIARARSAQASQRLQEMLGGLSSSTAAFERMEQRVLELETQADAIAELNSGDQLEQRFTAIESEASSVDSDLAQLKAKVAAEASLPPSDRNSP